MRFSVGIDEVGRGPLAGPVAVCAVQWIALSSPESVLANIRDSKKMTARNRIMWLDRAQGLGSCLRYAVHFSDARTIDTVGIVGAIRQSAERSLQHLHDRQEIVHVYADAGLPVPDRYPHTNIVRGDESNPLIALASVIAKVMRDDLLCRYGARFPQYDFEKNKGYGTAAHRAAIREHGVTPFHRRTFLKNLPRAGAGGE